MAQRAAGSGIEVKAYLFTAPDGFGFVKGMETPGVAGTYTGEEGEKLANSMARRPGFGLLEKKPVNILTKAGKKVEVSLIREFIYPTEYQPPVLGKIIDGGVQSVTPATPVTFESKELGVVLNYSAKRLEGGMFDVELDLKRDCFLGFVNYGAPIKGRRKGLFGREVDVTLSENRIEMPVFDARRLHCNVRVIDGDFIALGGMMPGKPPKDPRFQPWKGGSPESNGKNFVALIQVKSGTVK